eukprot:TRINITY_DN7030_c0_g2_i1.p1 TRINITY_DN7030_c0_g2~~TRINITY_DN7030_c0_g2_i1.p1  ORF type:complete len:223 (-),score=30.66 TRINITY_DN7030_c0_g2_i1:407-1075(-)
MSSSIERGLLKEFFIRWPSARQWGWRWIIILGIWWGKGQYGGWHGRIIRRGIIWQGWLWIIRSSEMSVLVRNVYSLRRPSVGAFGRGNGSTLWMKKAGVHPFHVEVVVGEGESEEVALKRFKRAVNRSGVVPEARRRMRFENSQDRKKRKLIEKFQAKKRTFVDEVTTYDQTHGIMEPSPFQDLFDSGADSLNDQQASVNALIDMASGGQPRGMQPPGMQQQ